MKKLNGDFHKEGNEVGKPQPEPRGVLGCQHKNVSNFLVS